MSPQRQYGLAGFVIALALSGTAQAQDAAKGRAVFAADCAGCHSVAKVNDNPTAPTLFGIVGRKAGAAADFAYSDAIKASGITWTPAKLDAFITSPSAVAPGSNMYFDGLSDPGDRADLIAYLKSLK